MDKTHAEMDEVIRAARARGRQAGRAYAGAMQSLAAYFEGLQDTLDEVKRQAEKRRSREGLDEDTTDEDAPVDGWGVGPRRAHEAKQMKDQPEDVMPEFTAQVHQLGHSRVILVPREADAFVPGTAVRVKLR